VGLIDRCTIDGVGLIDSCFVGHCRKKSTGTAVLYILLYYIYCCTVILLYCYTFYTYTLTHTHIHTYYHHPYSILQGEHYAMKIQSKVGLLRNYREDPSKAILEKTAYASCQHPFIVNMNYAFQVYAICYTIYAICYMLYHIYIYNKTQPDYTIKHIKHIKHIKPNLIMVGCVLKPLNLTYSSIKTPSTTYSYTYMYYTYIYIYIYTYTYIYIHIYNISRPRLWPSWCWSWLPVET
jgi:hypothetical protein